MLEQFDNLQPEAEETTEEEPQDNYQEEIQEEYQEGTEEQVSEEEEIPEKFRGKTKEEIAKSYIELERLRQKDLAKYKSEAEQKAQEAQDHYDRGDTKKGKKAESEMEEIINKINKEIDEADYTKMDPKSYGKMMIEKQREMAEAVMNRDRVMRDSIQKEISEVSKEYPILQEKTEQAQAFRDLVLDIVSASKSRGEDAGLKVAVQKASRAMGGIGTQPTEKKQPSQPAKKPRPVEKTQAATPGTTKTEEDAVKEGILSAGQQSGGLRGL